MKPLYWSQISSQVEPWDRRSYQTWIYFRTVADCGSAPALKGPVELLLSYTVYCYNRGYNVTKFQIMRLDHVIVTHLFFNGSWGRRWFGVWFKGRFPERISELYANRKHWKRGKQACQSLTGACSLLNGRQSCRKWSLNTGWWDWWAAGEQVKRESPRLHPEAKHQHKNRPVQVDDTTMWNIWNCLFVLEGACFLGLFNLFGIFFCVCTPV